MPPLGSRHRPLAITLVAALFIVAGALGLLTDLWPLVTSHAAEQLAKLRADGWADLGPAWGLRALAIVGGVWLARGRNWARWLLAGWMLVHVGVSVQHSVGEVLTHLAIFIPVTYLLFRPSATRYFRAEPPGSA